MEKTESPVCPGLPPWRGWPVALLAAAACCLAGCRGETGPAKYTVAGTVTLDGKQLSNGDVSFYPVAGNLPAAAGKLQDGRYTFRAVAGQHRVVIRAVSDKPIITSPIDPPRFESIVPARYNDATTLAAEVQTTGRNHFDFTLESDPPEKR